MIILYSIIAVVAISTAFGLFMASRTTGYRRWDDFWGYGFCLGAPLAAIVCVFNLIYANVTMETEHYKVSLTSIGAGSATEGSHFLGGGQIDTRGVFWYYRIDNGAATLHYRYASNTKIYQDETENPYMDCWERENAGPYASLNDHKFGSEARCDFHVPPGSVIQNYKLSTP